ncbi:hypothetical protein Aab01nite_19240 [Paractinoplanes abujensis]|uniref:Uncharacterized protein n=1 Tax=Paractinoplanes abujensis TaxID=882441 RepID=A0A7W7G4A8_9ACTN|nr:hypothetical protein [Actinoplanes abujensis]MBB4697193.1 hypothetical protein [Actinoplanes abujensis]GID18334.1 hypothetical protein Aab01nite_19240 [Actinoplanes abujensis]
MARQRGRAAAGRRRPPQDDKPWWKRLYTTLELPAGLTAAVVGAAVGLFIYRDDDKSPADIAAEKLSAAPGLTVEGSYNIVPNDFRVLSPPLTTAQEQVLVDPSQTRSFLPESWPQEIGGVVSGVDPEGRLGTPARLLLTAGGVGEVLITGVRSRTQERRETPDGAYIRMSPEGDVSPIPSVDISLDDADVNVAQEDGRPYPAGTQLTLQPGQQQYLDVWAHAAEGAYKWTAEVGYRQGGATRWVPVGAGLTSFDTVSQAPAYQQMYRWGGGNFERVR